MGQIDNQSSVTFSTVHYCKLPCFVTASRRATQNNRFVTHGDAKLFFIPSNFVGKLFSKRKILSLLKSMFSMNFWRQNICLVRICENIANRYLMNKFAATTIFILRHISLCKNFPHLGGICSLIGSGFVTTTRMKFVAGDPLSARGKSSRLFGQVRARFRREN